VECQSVRRVVAAGMRRPRRNGGSGFRVVACVAALVVLAHVVPAACGTGRACPQGWGRCIGVDLARCADRTGEPARDGAAGAIQGQQDIRPVTAAVPRINLESCDLQDSRRYGVDTES